MKNLASLQLDSMNDDIAVVLANTEVADFSMTFSRGSGHWLCSSERPADVPASIYQSAEGFAMFLLNKVAS